MGPNGPFLVQILKNGGSEGVPFLTSFWTALGSNFEPQKGRSRAAWRSKNSLFYNGFGVRALLAATPVIEHNLGGFLVGLGGQKIM